MKFLCKSISSFMTGGPLPSVRSTFPLKVLWILEREKKLLVVKLGREVFLLNLVYQREAIFFFWWFDSPLYLNLSSYDDFFFLLILRKTKTFRKRFIISGVYFFFIFTSHKKENCGKSLKILTIVMLFIPKW